MTSKKRIHITTVFVILSMLLISNSAFAVVQNYPTDYRQCYMPYHDYQPDWFCLASDTPTSQAYRDAQTYYASRIFKEAYGTTSNPRYTNMWGTYSTSQGGAHEGLDMIYGSTGQPIKHWGSEGIVTAVNSTTGLVAIYCSSINETIFYRHMNSITSGLVLGSKVYHDNQIGTQGQKGNADGVHLHCGVEWYNTSIDSPADQYFNSQNIYYAMQLFGY